jgi:hypothetical protein
MNMKEIKPSYIVFAVVFVLISWAIVHWIILPKDGLPKVAEFAEEETDLPEELPVLPQNELYNSTAAPSFSKDLPAFKESKGQDPLEPKDPALSGEKSLL